MAETSVTVDSMIKEYLVFRGFSLTLKSFEVELKVDKNKQFKVSFFLSQYPLQGCRKGCVRFLNSAALKEEAIIAAWKLYSYLKFWLTAQMLM